MDMMHPAFFAQFWYDELDYKYPLNDEQPVVRIPVAGPPPFNTLAMIRWFAPGSIEAATGNLTRHTFSFVTPLILRGYDPLRAEQQRVQHASAAYLRMMQIKEGGGPHIGDWNTDFVLALDRVHPEAKIGPLGQVILTFDSAESIDNRLASWQFQISSWVLCWEPPAPHAVPQELDTLRKLDQIGVDFSVGEGELRDWLANSQFTPYPAIAEALLLMQRGLKAPVFLDVIVFNYEHTAGVTSPRKIGDVRFDVLKRAILDGFNIRHGVNLSDPEEVFRSI